MFTYLQNLVKLTRGDFTLSPRLAIYYVTMQCNLNCAYCEERLRGDDVSVYAPG